TEGASRRCSGTRRWRRRVRWTPWRTARRPKIACASPTQPTGGVEMRADILQLAADLSRRGEAFVLAVVVRREPASSAQLGNTALITEAGEYHGWLGGSCMQQTGLREAAAAPCPGSAPLS